MVPPAAVEEPPVDDDGYDAPTLPQRAPEADWIPLVTEQRLSGFFVNARINGVDVVAQLDTGCTSTVMGVEVARRLGVARDDRALGAVDLVAFGETTRAQRYWAPLELGSWQVEQTPISVVDSDIDILIGNAFLSQFDLYIAADEGMVGFFPPQQAPLPTRAVAVPMPNDDLGTPVVLVGTANQSPTWFTLDTGAAATAVPAPWARGRSAIAQEWMTTVHGQRLNTRFAFELSVGTQGLNVGGAHASANGNNLGLDVVRRFHALLSPSRERLFLGQRSRPPPWRSTGARGAACTRDGAPAPCISVSLKAGSTDTPPQLCATLGPAAPRGQVALEVAASHADGSAAWGGGWATVYVPAGRGWRTTCHTLNVQDPLWSFSALELVRVRRVRAFPCDDGAACLSRGPPLP